MRFLSVYKTVEKGVPPTQGEMDRMGKLIEEGFKSGYLLAVDGCPDQLAVPGVISLRQVHGEALVRINCHILEGHIARILNDI
jgi:hypothetical protein